MRVAILALVISLICVSHASFAQEGTTIVVPGILHGTLGYRYPLNTGGHNWYRMEGLYTVPANDTLRIEGGVRIVFGRWCKWDIKGVLIAGGTNSMSVDFIGDTTGGIHPIREFLLDHPSGESQFRGCQWGPGYSGEVPEAEYPVKDNNPYDYDPERYLYGGAIRCVGATVICGAVTWQAIREPLR